MHDFYRRLMERHGKLVVITWLGAGLLLFATSGSAAFLSWQAPVFFLVGTFAAAIVLGGAFYLLQRGTEKAFAAAMGRSPGWLAFMNGVGAWLMAMEVVITFLLARYVIASLS